MKIRGETRVQSWTFLAIFFWKRIVHCIVNIVISWFFFADVYICISLVCIYVLNVACNGWGPTCDGVKDIWDVCYLYLQHLRPPALAPRGGLRWPGRGKKRAPHGWVRRRSRSHRRGRLGNVSHSSLGTEEISTLILAFCVTYANLSLLFQSHTTLVIYLCCFFNKEAGSRSPHRLVKKKGNTKHCRKQFTMPHTIVSAKCNKSLQLSLSPVFFNYEPSRPNLPDLHTWPS